MDNEFSMLRLQADLIKHEAGVLEYAAFACESNDLPETARGIRLACIILKQAAALIKRETDSLEEDFDNYDPADNGNQGS